MILMHMRMMPTRLFCEHGVSSWRFVFIVMLLFSVMTMHTNLFFAHKDTFWRFFSMEDVLYGCLDDHITYIFLFTRNLCQVWVNGSVNDFSFYSIQLGLVSNEDPRMNWGAYILFILCVLQQTCEEAVQCCLLIIRKLHIPNYHMHGIELSCHLGLKVSSSVSESWTQIARLVSLEQISDWSCSLLVHFQSCDYTSPYLLDNWDKTPLLLL